MSLGLCFWVIVIVAVVFFGALIGGLIGPYFGHYSELVILVLVLLLELASVWTSAAHLMPRRKPIPYWQPVIIVFFAILCAMIVVWSGLDRMGIQ